MDGFWVETAASPRTVRERQPSDRKGAAGPGVQRLSRTLTATPHDETYGPAVASDAGPWSATRGSAQDGSSARPIPGRAMVTAAVGPGQGSSSWRCSARWPGSRRPRDPERAERRRAGELRAAGFRRVRRPRRRSTPSTSSSSYDRPCSRSLRTADGRFRWRRSTGVGRWAGDRAGRVGLTATIAVSVGVEKKTLATFDDADKWTVGDGSGDGDGEQGAERRGRRRAEAGVRLQPVDADPERVRDPAEAAGRPGPGPVVRRLDVRPRQGRVDGVRALRRDREVHRGLRPVRDLERLAERRARGAARAAAAGDPRPDLHAGDEGVGAVQRRGADRQPVRQRGAGGRGAARAAGRGRRSSRPRPTSTVGTGGSR